MGEYVDLIAGISAVIAAVMSCISAYFAMMAATVDARHWYKAKKRKHDLIFIANQEYATWTLSKIVCDMNGVFPDNNGRLFPVQVGSDTDKFLKGLKFCEEVVDVRQVMFCDVGPEMYVGGVWRWLMGTKWFSVVDYMKQGRWRLKQDLKMARKSKQCSVNSGVAEKEI